jgi:uncharacterized protein (DUF1015 family)
MPNDDIPIIRPFAGLRPVSERVAEVVAPPYDVITAAEARGLVVGRPWSFLHISRAEIDFPPATDPYAPQVYERAAENLARMVREGILHRDPEPYYYLYQLIMGEHRQTGLVAVASVSAYATNRVRRHEFTRPSKEDDRVRQIDAVNAQTGPVLLTYRSQDVIDGLLTELTRRTPEVDVAAGKVQHRLWVIREPDKIAALSAAFAAVDVLYIADGHHRAAAAARVAERRRHIDRRHTGQEGYNFFLAVIIPDREMQILDYNRVVCDLNELSVQDLLARLTADFAVEPQPAPVRPTQSGEFGMYLGGRWYRLVLKPELKISADPVAALDVSLLAFYILEPILGITDPRRDPRIDFVGGIRGPEELVRRVDTGEMAIGFSLFPTRMEQLLAVADANEVMPPKSTWFEPKLVDGLISHLLD